ncbi:hypothetical protein J4573_37645 [Actinomadura barringtoniae]|uniref:Uncharacterized protein n=1 Tax=Actinomadura barringtoniae TaxID=1427535 RepID=A0A939PQH5_9ACTN|nr:hypothetical protein [Actinomadura barringtoniae]MBO2452866.1 hypothetical protein [Actinomadura barringtoniae]
MDVPPHPETVPAPSTRPDDRPVIGQIEAEFPGWSAWRSDTDRWWAFRTAANPLTIEQLRAGHRLIVQADTVAALRAEIRAEIESEPPVDEPSDH